VGRVRRSIKDVGGPSQYRAQLCVVDITNERGF
jgi:hypothetical protein